MKIKNNNSGVSMLTLVITIVVIIILALLAWALSTRTVEEANYSTYVNNVSEVGTFFEDTSVKMHGSEMLKDNTKRDEQIYNYVAKGGSGEADFLHVTELPAYTIIEENADVGIALPKVKVESGTGKMVPIKYASTKNGKIFTWPPYEHNGELWITPNDTVESKMQTAIKVGEEFFTIEIDYKDGTLIGAKPGTSTTTKPDNSEDSEDTGALGDSNNPGGTGSEEGSNNQGGTENENGSQNNGGDVNEGGTNNSGNTGNEGGSNTSGGSNNGSNQGGSNGSGTDSHQHDFSAKAETSTYLASEATCISATKYYYKCTGCSEKGTNTYTSGKSLGHDFKQQDPTEKYLATEASCVLQPKYYFKCVRCDAKGTETYASGNPLGHEYGDYKIDKAANCKEEGQRSKTCTRCLGTEVEKMPIDSSNHAGGKTSKTEKDATCTSGGSKKILCGGCNAVLGTESTKALGHSYTAKVGDSNFKASDATCTEGEKYYYKCSRCSDKGTDTYVSGDALGHNYKDVVTDATCKDKGYTTHTCENCKDVVVDSYTEVGDHSWSEWETLDAGTCTVPEIQQRSCNVCGEKETNNIPAPGHDYELVEDVEASCNNEGYTRYSCKKCGDVKTENYTEALEHNYGELQIVKEATCTEKGLQQSKCIRCEDLYEIEIEELGHDFGEWEVYVEATCIQAGEFIRTCSRCDEEEFDYTDIDSDNHVNVATETKTQPKCTTTGVQTLTCHDCDIVLEEMTVDALGHDFTVQIQEDEYVAAEANCTSGKTYYYQCSRCEEKSTETYEVGEALGHEFGAPTFNWAADHCSCMAVFECVRGDKKEEIACGMKIDVLKDVSCEESGEHLYTATATFQEQDYVDTYLDIVPPQGHQYGDPNFNVSNESGYIHAEQECSCGQIHSTDVDIVGEEVEQEPTCEGSGSKNVTVTTTIGGVTYTQTITVVIPPKGHEGETEFVWTDNYTKATAIFRCSCGDEQTAEATVSVTGTRLPTCTQAGYTKYTATAIFEGETFSENYTLYGEPLGHSLNAPVFTWAADNKSATVTVTCAHGDFTETEKAAMSTSTPVPALCETEGVLRYTASVRVNNVLYTDYRDFTIPATGHMGSTSFAWSGDYTAATATFTCNCGSIKTAEAEIESEITKDPTCTEVGEITYTATAVIDEVTYTDIQTADIAELGHTYGEPTFIWAENNKDADATVTCQVCGYEETKSPSIKVETITSTTCDTDGLKKYTASLTINEIEYTDSREVVIEAYNHSKTKLVGKTDDYTGDVVCYYCGTILEKGTGPQVKALLLADNSLVFVKNMTTYAIGEAYEETTISAVYKESELNTDEFGSDLPWDLTIAAKIKKVIVKDSFAPANTAWWFNYFTSCTEYDLAKLDMSKVTSMESMFRNNTQLTNIDVSGWNTSTVTNMDGVFEDCTKLKNIVGLADWDTSSVEDMYGMFKNCIALQKLTDISGWNTAKVSNMNFLFAGMSNLRELDITNWSRGQYATDMFEGCVRLEKITYGEKFTFHPNGRLPSPDSNYISGIGYGHYWYILDEVLDGDVQSYYPSYMPTGKVVTCVAAVYNVYYSGVNDATFDPERVWLYSKYSPDFTLRNPTKEGSEFIGWTGNGITTPTTSMVVPTGSTGVKNFTANWKLLYEVPKSANVTYNGTAQTLLKSSVVNYGTMYYRLGESGEWSTSIPQATDAGTYNIYYYVSASEEYEQTEVMGPVVARIYKADGVITTHPTAIDLTYNGSYQALVTAGTSSTGTMRYNVSGEYGYYTSIPTERNAGDYYVYYYADSSTNYDKTTTKGPIKVTIKKADATFSYEPTALNLRYNGEWQNLLTSGYSRYGTVYYRVGTSGAWSTSIPTARDNGQYDIYYYIEGNDNVNASEVMGPITATITGFPGQITPPGALNLTYTGEAQELVTPATSTTGTVYYKLGGTGTWTTEIPTATNAGTYRIYYYASESGDYIETSRSVYVTSKITKDESGDTDLENCALVYNQPYVLNIGSVYIDLIFRNDGSADFWLADEEGSIISSDYIRISGNTILIAADGETITLTVSETGSQLIAYLPEDGEVIELAFNLTPVEPQYIRYGQEYIGIDFNNNNATNKVIFAEDGSVISYVNDVSGEAPAGTIVYNEYSLSSSGLTCPIYPDGSRILIDGIIYCVQESVIKFNEPYSMATGDSKLTIILHEDGSYDYYEYTSGETVHETYEAGSLEYTYNSITLYSTDESGDTTSTTYQVSRDGVQIITDSESGIICSGFVLEDVITPLQMDGWYVMEIQNNGEKQEQGYLVPHADGSLDLYGLDFTLEESMPYGVVYGANNKLNFMGAIVTVSADGKTITIIPTYVECKLIKNDSPNLEETAVVCNQPYRIGDDTANIEFVFREDRSVEVWSSFGQGIMVPKEDVTISGDTIIISGDVKEIVTVSASGDTLTADNGEVFTLTRVRQNDFFFDHTYIYSGDSIVIEGIVYEDGSATLNYNGYITEISTGGVEVYDNKLVTEGIEIPIYPDGLRVMYNGMILETADTELKLGEAYSASLGGVKGTLRFFADGSYTIEAESSIQTYPAGSCTYTSNTVTISGDDTGSILLGTHLVLDDGAKIVLQGIDIEYDVGFVLESDETSIVFETPYAIIESGEITGYAIIYEDETMEFYSESFELEETIEHCIVFGKNNNINFLELLLGTVSNDGRYITLIPGELELELSTAGICFEKLYSGTLANGTSYQYRFHWDGSMDCYENNVFVITLPAGMVTYGDNSFTIGETTYVTSADRRSFELEGSVFAIAEEGIYHVTYNAGGWDYEIEFPNGQITTYATASGDIALIAPTRDGYDFRGWVLKEGDDPIENMVISSGSTGDKEFIPVWKTEGTSIVELKYNDDVTSPTEVEAKTSADLPTPTREGYTFDGWYLYDSVVGEKTLVTFTNPNDTYGWVKDAEGVWSSTNSLGGYHNTTSNMLSEEFAIGPDGGTISFDWKSYGESYYDYLGYDILNVETGTYLSGYTTPTYRNCIANLRGASSTTFTTVNHTLPEGRYKILFMYGKDGSVDNYDDKGYVKNIVATGALTETPTDPVPETITEDISVIAKWTAN